jgi:hypothetical protein
MVVVSLSGFLSKELSNKPVFQDYAHQAMFQQASNLIVAWNLDLPRPITTNMVTHYSASAYVEGINGSLVFSNRYSFAWHHDKLDQFNDEPYIEERAKTLNVDTNDALFEQWMRATNLLTMEKARIIAESVMQSVGVPMGKGKFKKPDYMTQMTYEWKDDKKYPMPFFRFRWKGDNSNESHDYEVQVSGITSNVLHCHFLFGSPYLKSIKPINYFQMFGLQPKPIFVYSREKPFFFLPTISMSPSNSTAVHPKTYELYPLQK